DVEAPAPSGAAVCAAHRGNRTGMPRGREPVMHSGPDLAALDRRLSGAMMAGDQPQHTLPAGDRLIEASVNCGPGAVEVQTMEVEHAIRIGTPAGKLAVPAAVESSVREWHRPWLGLHLRSRAGSRS